MKIEEIKLCALFAPQNGHGDEFEKGMKVLLGISPLNFPKETSLGKPNRISLNSFGSDSLLNVFKVLSTTF